METSILFLAAVANIVCLLGVVILGELSVRRWRHDALRYMGKYARLKGYEMHGDEPQDFVDGFAEEDYPSD